MYPERRLDGFSRQTLPTSKHVWSQCRLLNASLTPFLPNVNSFFPPNSVCLTCFSLLFLFRTFGSYYEIFRFEWNVLLLSSMGGLTPKGATPATHPNSFQIFLIFPILTFLDTKKEVEDTGSVCVDFLYIKLIILYHSPIYLSRTFVRNVFSRCFHLFRTFGKLILVVWGRAVAVN